MSYDNFTLKHVRDEFSLEIVEQRDLFSHIEPIAVSDHLQTTLDYNLPLALAMSTEKARSELIISNVLIELKKFLNDEISLFSGINLDVDKERDLTGYCDYIVSKSGEQFYVSAPVVVVVEAKNEHIPGGLGQCIAEMIAADVFNQREGKEIPTIYGSVTTGNTWKFLQYADGVVSIDRAEYYIVDVGKILAILASMVRGGS